MNLAIYANVFLILLRFGGLLMRLFKSIASSFLILCLGSAASAATTYSVLVESDPGGLGNLNYGEFDTLTDVKNWNVSSSSFIGQNLFGSGVSVGGYTYDGSKYHVVG